MLNAINKINYMFYVIILFSRPVERNNITLVYICKNGVRQVWYV